MCMWTHSNTHTKCNSISHSGIHWHLIVKVTDIILLASSKLWSFFLRFQISSNGDTQIYSVFSCASGVPTLTRCENSLPMPQERVYSLIMLIRMKCGMTICWFSCSLDHTESIFVCVRVVLFFPLPFNLFKWVFCR